MPTDTSNCCALEEKTTGELTVTSLAALSNEALLMDFSLTVEIQKLDRKVVGRP